MKRKPIQKTVGQKVVEQKTMRAKIVTAGEGPLISVGSDGLPRFNYGTFQGKALPEIARRDLTALLKRKYAHSTDPTFLLTEHLSREYGRPMTIKDAVEAMREQHAQMQHQWEERLRQPSLASRLLGGLAEKLNETADKSDEGDEFKSDEGGELEVPHDADTWPFD